jgi:hypothetical protein
MNSPWCVRNKPLSLLQLGQNKTASVSARRGTVVGCLSGELWVTQAGDRRDYIVASGYRYRCSEDGLIVVNSVRGLSNALVYWSNPDRSADVAGNPVQIDFESRRRLIQQAHTLRRQAIGHVGRRLWRNLGMTWRWFMKRCRNASRRLLL